MVGTLPSTVTGAPEVTVVCAVVEALPAESTGVIENAVPLVSPLTIVVEAVQ